MDLQEAEYLAEDLMSDNGIDHWEFAFNPRLRSNVGMCRHGRKLIELSTLFTELNQEPVVRDVILHEIAHAKAGPAHQHGPHWQAWARRVGARPERCQSEGVAVPYRWRATCPCHHSFGWYRKPRTIRICRACRTELAPVAV